MHLVPRIALVLLCLAPLAATAQWQWVDKDGQKVFSDRPPPSDVPANRILRQPGSRASGEKEAAAPVAAAAPAAAASGVDPRLKPAGKDKALEEKRKQAEAAEAEKKKAEEEKLAAARQGNCNRARSTKITLESGRRVTITNAKGEPDYLTDEARAAEIKRIDQVIARDCRTDRQ
jgi:hypothetical protein